MSNTARPRVARAASAGLAGALLITAGALAASGSAAAESSHSTQHRQVAVKEACGYLGSGIYRHCDGGTGSTVMLDVDTFFWGTGHYCVGPGKTNLQPVYRWAVIGASWNGGVGCQPGKYN